MLITMMLIPFLPKMFKSATMKSVVSLTVLYFFLVVSCVPATASDHKEESFDFSEWISRNAAAGASFGSYTWYKALQILNNLEFSKIDPSKYLSAGTRGQSRTLLEARKVWESVPRSVRAAGPKATANFLRNKDWSHVVPHSRGGSDLAKNGVWEHQSLNRSRGDSRMTPREVAAARHALRSGAMRSAIVQAAKSAAVGSAITMAVTAVISILDHGLRFQSGEITEREMYRLIGYEIAIAGITSAVIIGITMLAALTLPPIAAILSVAAPILLTVAVLALGITLFNLGKGWYEFLNSDHEFRPLTLSFTHALNEIGIGMRESAYDSVRKPVNAVKKAGRWIAKESKMIWQKIREEFRSHID